MLVDASLPADVVTHVAWHRLAAKALSSPKTKPSVAALFLGESIASAFDLYLVGRILGHAPKSSFLTTQVLAMAETAEAAGLDEIGFAELLGSLADAPEESFASLLELLLSATEALFASLHAEAALEVVTGLESHRFGPLLHRYDLATWILYARAYGDPEASTKVSQVRRSLRDAKDPLQWLTDSWVLPALGQPRR